MSTRHRRLGWVMVTLLALTDWHVASQAHQNPCHRLHRCPSDHNTYVCGDKGRCDQCPDNPYCLAGKPRMAPSGHPAPAPPPPSRTTEVWEVEAAFREAIQLWADERFEALWEHGLLASRYRMSREAFVRGMRHRVVRPTCCWGQLRTVQVHLRTAEEALVEAQVGVDVKTLGTTAVRGMLVYLQREEGVWRLALEDFLTKPEGGQPGLGWLW